MSFDGTFNGKVVLVTGGSRGLGKAISEGFAAAGAKVVVSSRKLENCEAVVAGIRDSGGEAYPIAAHVGDIGSLDGLIDGTYAQYGKLDILVNNAGTNIAMGPLSDLTPEQYDKMYQVNQRGPWYLASRAAPKMGEHGGGCIINLLSVAALRPQAYMGFYASTKAALEAMTKVMAQEWSALNIRVNGIAPGTYHSDLTDGAMAAIPNFEEGVFSRQLIQRIADSEEILKPIFYLADDSYTTGVTLVADAGMTAM